MPRPVCVACRREMEFVSAVTVQFNAFSTGGPYQQYQGDLARCPGCARLSVIRFGEAATWLHHYGRDHETFNPKPFIVVRERRGDGTESV
jgi:hypothetical protein